MLDRRRFLTQCGGVTASFLFAPGVMASGNGATPPSRQLFAALIDQSFRGYDEQNVALNFVLLEIREEPQAPGLEQFTLVFEETYRISREPVGGLYRMVHPDTGQLLMRLDPSASGPRLYTSHFSLLV